MNFNRVWNMPNHETFKIKQINDFIVKHIPSFDQLKGIIIDPFANRPSDYGAVTNDLNPNSNVQFHLDAIDFLELYDDDSVGVVLFDPPYSLRQVKECYNGIGIENITKHQSNYFYSDLKNEISRVLAPGGIALSFGWSSVGIGKSRGFEITDILLVCHGGNHNDTICIKEIKKEV